VRMPTALKAIGLELGDRVLKLTKRWHSTKLVKKFDAGESQQ